MPLDVAAVEARLKARGIPWAIRHVPECSSTQDLAAEAAAAGRGAGLVVSTDFQRSGRGRRDARWIAPRDTALLVSVLLEPSPSLLPLCPLLAGVAVVDGIAAAGGPRADLEWPNDVTVGGRKLAGILVQHPPGPLVIVGIGVNVSAEAAAFPAGARATSLALELGRPVLREPLLAAILAALFDRSTRATEAGPRSVLRAWRRRSRMIGRRIAFEDAGRQRTGIAAGLLEDGALLVRLEDGALERLYAGAVRHVTMG